ncbi:MAG: hypothetical protein BSOLF_0050 [Candidatus Carbobacillus altaicus]|uniref:Uncharacterized protein n=1 Tax=Candidatus Carbonibacillus altaicus TaxID=2163959 RepID=A0A2R6XXM1_9BACL|nr:MAG: hypothetical protein BSOLF_0050 [Candidatus Carbobacillus altaicus]
MEEIVKQHPYSHAFMEVMIIITQSDDRDDVQSHDRSSAVGQYRPYRRRTTDRLCNINFEGV